jgi:RNA polymerase sigma-70 factor (ECF subfamily)
MPDDDPFPDFLRRIRGGDASAAEQLVRRYERVIRVTVRARLSDPGLQRVLDSTDVCQSVLASFFVRAHAGQYDLDSPDQLVALLVQMARNKLAMHARHHHSQKRDGRKLVNDSAVLAGLSGGAADDPQRLAAGRELIDKVRARLDPEARAVAELRADGRDWAAVAAELGGTAEGRRKQFTRALDRATADLGLDSADEDEHAN